MHADSIEGSNPLRFWMEGYFLSTRRYFLFSAEGLLKDANGRPVFLERVVIDRPITSPHLKWEDGLQDVILAKTDFGGYRTPKQWAPKIRKLYEWIGDHTTFWWLFYTPDCSTFQIYRFDGNRAIRVIEPATCHDLSQWIIELTGKRGGKGFYHPNKLRCIDQCLRTHQTPYPGNLDAMIFDLQHEPRPVAILEFSRVNYTSARNHQPDRYLSADHNRWQILIDTGQYFNIPIYALFWGRYALDVRIFKVIDTPTGIQFQPMEYVTGKIWKQLFSNLH